MSTPYNPTGSSDNNDQPDYLTDRSAESSEPTTNLSRSESGSEWGTGEAASSSEWDTSESTSSASASGASSSSSSSSSEDTSWGAPSQTQSQYGQSDYGQAQSYNQYGQPQYGQSDYSQSDYGQTGYGSQSQQQGQAQHQYGQTDYSQAQYGAQQYQQYNQGQNYGQTQAQYGTQHGQYQPGQFGAPQGGFQQPVDPGAVRKRDGDSFFKALFDFSFSRYITIDFVKVIYAIVLAFIALGWVVGLFASFSGFADGVGTGFLFLFGYLIVGTAVAFLWLVLARMGLEFYVAMVKTAQNTSKLVEYEKDKA